MRPGSASAALVCFCGIAGLLHQAQAQEAQCGLGPYIRPVILIGGFRASPLFNSSNDFSLEWVNPADMVPGKDKEASADLKLPLTWNAANLTQDETDVGPEAFPGDDTPSLQLPNGDLVPILVPVRCLTICATEQSRSITDIILATISLLRMSCLHDTLLSIIEQLACSNDHGRTDRCCPTACSPSYKKLRLISAT